jgi:hypothetical protein
MCTNFQKVENIIYTSLRFKVRFKIYYKEYMETLTRLKTL